MPVDCQRQAAARISPCTLGAHFGAHSAEDKLHRPAFARLLQLASFDSTALAALTARFRALPGQGSLLDAANSWE
jgi:hypothetical protein